MVFIIKVPTATNTFNNTSIIKKLRSNNINIIMNYVVYLYTYV